LRRAGREPRPDGTRRGRGRGAVSDLYELRTRPDQLVDFHEPVLVIGLEGWIDAGLGAATAMAALLAATGTEVVATFDVDAELAASFDVRLAVGLGAFPAPVPHTRPCRLAATATTPELAHQVGYVGGTLEVPAGVEAALEARFAAAGVPAVGLWARVPHYVS